MGIHMKLNADDFRKSLEEKKRQKKDSENSFMRMQQDLQASIQKRVEYLTQLTSHALDAALNGQHEVGLDIDEPTEYEDYLRSFGFRIENREVESDSLLRKIRKISAKEQKALLLRIQTEVSKMVTIFPPESGTYLDDTYQEYLSTNDDLEVQLKNLLKVIGDYNIEYRENDFLSEEEDAKLWLHLSRLQEVIDFYDAENYTEESVQPFLSWENNYIQAEKVPDESTSYSLLNPNKLRFFNSDAGDKFFSKIANEINEKTDELQSFIQFDLLAEQSSNQILFSDNTDFNVPFSALDLQTIFEKMGFKTTIKNRSLRNTHVTTFKIKF